jgi:hypothetical protein
VLAQLESGELSAGHGRSLLGLDSAADQAALAKDAAARRLSVRDTEKLVRDRQTSADDVERRAVEADLARALGTRVHVKHHTDNSGRIIIGTFRSTSSTACWHVSERGDPILTCVWMPATTPPFPEKSSATIRSETMALFVKDDKTQKSDEPLQAAAPASAAAAAGARDVQAHLGQGSRVEGKLTFEGSVRIDGQVEGEITAQEMVILGETADVSATIVANTIVVQGRVTGDLDERSIRLKGRLENVQEFTQLAQPDHSRGGRLRRSLLHGWRRGRSRRPDGQARHAVSYRGARRREPSFVGGGRLNHLHRPRRHTRSK